MDHHEVRRWVEGHRAAQARGLDEERAQPVDVDESLARAFALMSFTDRFCSPTVPDHVSQLEDHEVLASWARLRRVWSNQVR